MNMLVVVIGLGLLLLHRYRDRFVMPKWVWTGIGLFLLFMLLRNSSEVYSIVSEQSDAWWPVVEDIATKLSDGLRDMINHLKNK